MAGAPGRPSKDTPERMAVVIEALRRGNTREAAARAAGIGPATLRRYLALRPEMREIVEDAEADAERGFVEALHRAANEAEVIDYYDNKGNLLKRVTKYDWKAALAWLERRRAKDWKSSARLEVSGPDGGPIERRVTVWQPTREELFQMALALRELPPDVQPKLVGPGTEPAAEPVQPPSPTPPPGDLPIAD